MSEPADDFFTPLPSSKQKSSPIKSEQDDFFKPIKELSKTRSVISAPIKGALKGIQDQLSSLPFMPGGPIPAHLANQVIDRTLPTRNEEAENILERGGKLGSYVAAGEGGLLGKAARAGAGALAGYGLEKLGAPKGAQDIGELLSLSAPDLAKRIPEKAAQSKVVNFLRGKGFTENEITPLIQSPEKLARYAKFAQKGQKTTSLMKNIYSKFDDLYSGIRNQGEAGAAISESGQNTFIDSLENLTKKISPRFRRLIDKDVSDLMGSEMKFNDFMNFYQDLNAEIGAQKGGKAVLGLFKQPVNEAMSKINPALAEEFSLTNELYSKRSHVIDALNPGQIDTLIGMGEVGTLMAGVADQNFGLIKKVLGYAGATKLAREVLINPRLQNLSKRMLNAIKDNKIPVALKMLDEIKKQTTDEESKSLEKTPQS